MTQDRRFVYFDKREYGWKLIEENYLNSDGLIEYFGEYGLTSHLNNEDEFEVFEVIPYKTFKKELKFVSK